MRELRNVIEHAMFMSSGRTLTLTLPKTETAGIPETFNLQDLERRHILAVLEKSAWRIMGAGGAADILGMKRTTLQARMKNWESSGPPADAEVLAFCRYMGS